MPSCVRRPKTRPPSWQSGRQRAELAGVLPYTGYSRLRPQSSVTRRYRARAVSFQHRRRRRRTYKPELEGGSRGRWLTGACSSALALGRQQERERENMTHHESRMAEGRGRHSCDRGYPARHVMHDTARASRLRRAGYDPISGRGHFRPPPDFS